MIPDLPLSKQEELVGLVRQMGQLQLRIQELSGDEIDAVLDDVGQPLLLRGAQEHLRDLAARQSALLDALPARVALLDSQGQTVAVNHKWREFEQTGAFVQLPDFSQGLRQVLDGEIPQLYEEYSIEGPEEKEWWLLQVTPIDHGSGLGAVVLHVDISGRRRSKEDSERHASLLRMASQMSRLGAWAVEVPSLQLTWSQEVYDIHEVAEDYPLSVESALEFYLPSYRSEVTAAFTACVEGGIAYSLETQLVTARGRTVWARTLGEAVRDESGTVVRVQGAFQDITEKKGSEQREQDSAAGLISVLDSIRDGFFTLDHDWRFTYVNKETERIVGRSRSQLLGQDIGEVFSESFGASFECECQAASREHQTREFEAFYPPLQLWLGVRLHPTIEGLAIYFKDATQPRLARQALAAQAALLDQTSDAIVVFSPQRRVLFWYKGAEAVYGWSAQEALGQQIDSWLQWESEPFRLAEKEVLAAGEWSGEVVHHTKTGRALRILARWTLVRDEQGEPTSILGIHTDITERKLHEEQFLRTQRLDSIGTLAGGLAHDLNNLLAPILLASEILTEFVTEDEGLQILETVSSSARRGAELIKRVLSFARGVEGERRIVDPEGILDEVRQVVRDTFPRNITIGVEASPGLWPVQADPTQLHQVIMNLCVNARDAMPVGGKLTLSLENVVVDEVFARMDAGSRPGNYVLFKAEDTGSGMSALVRDRIFEPFFTTKEVGAGTGLGLSTVFSIVRGHGGFIDVYSEPGRGTCFKVYFPAQPDAGTVAGSIREQALPLMGNGEMVLLVDDEKDVRNITKRVLERSGYRTLQAENGADAVRVYLQHRDQIAVVLTDLSMPVMDGPAAIVALRSINPRVRIVGSSGLHSDANVARATVVGMEHFIPKPYTAASLLKVLRQALAEPESAAPAPAAPLPPRPQQSPVLAPATAKGKGETILIVDDLPEQTILARRILQRAEYSVLTAQSAPEALLTLERLGGAVDLLITDLRMPGMHGSELARQVRSLYPQMRVLFVSGGGENESEDGISVLSKPYAPKVLLERARAALESKN